MADLFDPDLAQSVIALVLGGQERPFEGRLPAKLAEAGRDYSLRQPGGRAALQPTLCP